MPPVVGSATRLQTTWTVIFSQAQNNAKEALIDLGGKLADRVALGAMRWVSAALFLGTAAWNLFNH